MALQISTFDCKREDLIGYGQVSVRGDGVHADFTFGPLHEITKEAAERQARVFVMAMDGMALAAKLKAVQDSLSNTIAAMEGQQ